jgi:hypothetical protein
VISGYARLTALAAAAGTSFALAFVVSNDALSSFLALLGLVPLSLGLFVLEIRAGALALNARRGPVRPVVLTAAALCAGVMPALFAVLGAADLLGGFQLLGAPEIRTSIGSGLELTVWASAKLAQAAAGEGALVVVVVALLQLQPSRRRARSVR